MHTQSAGRRNWWNRFLPENVGYSPLDGVCHHHTGHRGWRIVHHLRISPCLASAT